MSDQIAITVYVPCHNYGSFLKEAVESVFKQSFKNWELIIIDDGSTDDTPDVIRLYEGVPGVKTIRTEGVGLPAVCNIAIKKASGKYIIRLDGDDVFDENILLVLINYLENHPSTFMVFPDYYLMDQIGNIFSHERRRKLYEEDHILDIPPNGACILARTDLLREIGGYREDLGAQDGLDLWVRVREKYKCGNVNLPLFYYRRHYHNLTGATGESPVIKYARRQIKKDITKEKLRQHGPVTAVVPIRKYFDFVESFWSQEIGGKSMLELALDRLCGSDVFDHIIVSSDDEDAREVLTRYKDPRLGYHVRTFESTYRTAPLSDLLQDVLAPLDADMKGLTVINYVQAPFLTRESVEEAIYTLLLADADAAISVEEFDDANFYVKSAYGLQSMQFHRFQYLDGGKIYHNTNVCSAVKNVNVRKGNIRGPRLAHYTVTGPEGFFVGNEHNFEVAKVVAEK
ncbi:glycosyltransferase [Owenweeksia hongkongensis]|uniref:glycosyltransferase n=1 Tax=Owenweeksia hongkongensis TaxID=253245 RepID=UPI003A907EDE